MTDACSPNSRTAQFLRGLRRTWDDMLRMFAGLFFGAVALLGSGDAAHAESRQSMLNECSSVGQTYFRDFNAPTEMQYNGQRMDGTHAISGRILLETRAEAFSCSYAPGGRRMVEFFAEGHLRNAYLPGGGSDPGGREVVQVTRVPSGDVLNVREGPGTTYRIVGALGNGDRVRRLVCQDQGSARWCRIEMLTDMREHGWVNARYLTDGTATHLPGQPPSHAGSTTTERIAFASGQTGTEITRSLAPGASTRFVVRARDRQDLYVRVVPSRGSLDYQIFNPDGTFLLGMIPAEREYRGQLWQSGNHVIEVVNRSNRTIDYNLIVGIR